MILDFLGLCFGCKLCKISLSNLEQKMSSCGEKDLKTITEVDDLVIDCRGEAQYFVCFNGMVEESRAKMGSETALSLTADVVFGN
jgi:hypothetical protein